MVHGNASAKGDCISKAVAIVGELRDSLDHKVDPTFSQRLESLYEYVTRRLLFAQLNDDLRALDEAAQLLAPVREGWQGIRGAYLAQASAQAVRRVMRRGAFRRAAAGAGAQRADAGRGAGRATGRGPPPCSRSAMRSFAQGAAAMSPG